MLIVAGFLAFFIGLVHSVLGERYVLIRLFRRDNLPKLFGGDAFTRQTLRFAWHLTTVAWWGLGALLILLSWDDLDIRHAVLYTVAAVFLISGILSAGFTRGKHLSWLVFFAIAALSLLAASS